MPPHHKSVRISGEITEVFAHRFVLKSSTSTALADIGPKAAESVHLKIGDHVDIEGEERPSEIKISKFSRHGIETVVEWPKPKPPGREAEADPSIATKSVMAAGYTVVGVPRRKPKHFEVLGRKGDGFEELHVELDGHIRKSKPVTAGDDRWKDELSSSQA